MFFHFYIDFYFIFVELLNFEIMIFSTITGELAKNAELKKTPDQSKEYAFFIVKSTDEKNVVTFVKCYWYGCSKKSARLMREGRLITVFGTQNVSLFHKENNEVDINININVARIDLRDYEQK